MKLKRTSHFIGFKLDSEAFVDIYLPLQQFLNEHNLGKCIELQNILSLHITLYYFQSDLSAKDLTNIENFISSLRKERQKYTISIKGFEYFRKEDKEILLYLRPENDSLSLLRKDLTLQFQRDAIVDNQYAFIPHITLFKIINSDIYQKNRDQFEKIIKQYIEEINLHEIPVEINFFAVYSQGSPEIQIPLR